ncbi:uncharacterized protein [Panulirus ornatus]|uniref:uncharacterized protein isoform X2 n=1 Tax=Panulirus ornatus TaxID=150431 RepID=UPI003A879A0F
MWLLKQAVTLVVVIGVSSSAINSPSTTEAPHTSDPTATTTLSSTILALASAGSTSTISGASATSPSANSATSFGSNAEAKEPQQAYVLPSAFIRHVETPAVVEEVDKDWSDGNVYSETISVDDEEFDDADDMHVEEDGEDYDDYKFLEGNSGHSYAQYPQVEEYSPTDHSHREIPNFEQFQANVPEAIHYKKDVIINKDNLIPLLKTISLAYTHKESPSYSDLLKAGGISALKTSLKYLGKEKLGLNLLTLAKKLTTLLDEDEADESESSEFLSELAEEFLAKHRFQLVVPESFLLHQQEMEDFLSTRMQHEIEGRSATSDKELSISMPRADPTVTTLLSIGPMSWLAILGGLFSIPYFLSSSTPEARVDAPVVRPSPNLRAPGLPFFRTHQLRRDEHEQVPHHQLVDQEYMEYQKTYAQWYYQWYLKYKEYYDKHYPYSPQSQPQGSPQKQENPTNFLTPPAPQKTKGETVRANSPRRRPHQQQRRQPSQKPQQQPQKPRQQSQKPRQQSQITRQQTQKHQQQVRKPTTKQPLPKRPRNQQPRRRPHQRPAVPRPIVSRPQQRPVVAKSPFPRPQHLPAGPRVPPLRPVNIQDDESRHSGINAAAATPGIKPNTFGTFQREDHRGDSHFKVIHGPGAVSPTDTPPASRVPSPQPVYIPTTERPPRTETGFKPIIKPDSPVADNTSEKRQTSTDSTPTPKEIKPGFRPPKQETIFPKSKSTPTPKSKPTAVSAAQTSLGGFKPIPITTPPKTDPETTTRKVSSVTSSVFKTSAPPTPAPATTPQPAIFFRTVTEKSVRVVTSSSVVTPPTVSFASETKNALPDLRRPPRHQESQSLSQVLASTTKPQPPKLQPPGPQVKIQQDTASVAPRLDPLRKGFVRTNVPTSIKVVDHRPAQGFGLVTEPQGSTTTTAVPIYALDTFYGSRLSRIDAIFHQMKVEEEGCREQVVCNIYKNPDVYTPYSDFLSRQLTVTMEELQRPKVSDDRILRFFRYLRSAREGQDGSECQELYPECHIDTATLSHKPIMSTFERVSLLMDATSN